MITVEKARETILARIAPLEPEKIYIEDALGRYLAEDIVSDRDIPAWNNSAMDGYAVHRDDITEDGSRLSIAYEIPAGSMPQGPFPEKTTVKIMTGAPVPPGADAVVKREDIEELPACIVVKIKPGLQENIRFKGEDIRKGDLILRNGINLDPSHMGVLASIRRYMVLCRQRPVVAIMATGDEVADLDEELTENKISSSNSYSLKGLVQRAGAIPLYLGVAKDTKQDLTEKLSRAVRADLILTSGGVSMGDYDIVREVMTSEKNTMDFWKVEMKPGRPLAFGRINGIPAIGLPGNPQSTMISFYQFARPAILKLMGAKNLLLPRCRARLNSQIRSTGDRPHYQGGIIEFKEGELCVSPAGPPGSGILSTMAKSNCYMVIPKGVKTIDIGDLVDCEIFHMNW